MKRTFVAFIATSAFLAFTSGCKGKATTPAAEITQDNVVNVQDDSDADTIAVGEPLEDMTGKHLTFEGVSLGVMTEKEFVKALKEKGLQVSNMEYDIDNAEMGCWQVDFNMVIGGHTVSVSALDNRSDRKVCAVEIRDEEGSTDLKRYALQHYGTVETDENGTANFKQGHVYAEDGYVLVSDNSLVDDSEF